MSKVMGKEEVKDGGAVGAGEAKEAVKAIRIEWKRVFGMVAVRLVGSISRREFARFRNVTFSEKGIVDVLLRVGDEYQRCINLSFGHERFSFGHNSLNIPDGESDITVILVSCEDFTLIRDALDMLNSVYAKSVAGCDGIADEGSI